MGGFFIRPKDTNIDSNSTSTSGKLNAEAIAVVTAYDNEYIPVTGFDSDTDGLSGAIHRRDPIRREAPPGSPLPTGGRSAGISSPNIRGWRTPVGRRGSLKGR
jgi:hypothetical protein